MGQSQSAPEPRDVPIEQLSHELALKFADKCYSHLEIAHFKDNFKTLADHNDGIEYWKEDTLCGFLYLPEALRAGAVIFQMCTYLGSFPFPSLAPCILTRESMLKIVTILTGRYRKVLKRGGQDKNKLLFRSLAVFDRSLSTAVSDTSKPDASTTTSILESQQQTTGFAVDVPVNDDEDEDDDDLAMAALDALDAIEVFKIDQKQERKLNKAHVPAANFERLVMAIFLFAPLTPLSGLSSFSESLDEQRLEALSQAAKAVVAAFSVNSIDGGIGYSAFMETLATTLPGLFRPLSPLFEHFLFSKNIDLSKHTGRPVPPSNTSNTQFTWSGVYSATVDSKPEILNDIILAQLSSSFEIGPVASQESSSFFHPNTRFDELYSTASHGTSLSSFSRQVLSWKSATLFLLAGTADDDDEPFIIGGYLPVPWSENVTIPSQSEAMASAVLFQLRPQHAVFRANKYNKTAPLSFFSNKTGIALGCVIPSQSRVQSQHQKPVLGPVSLSVNDGFSMATFQHDGNAGSGAFMTDPRLEAAQNTASREERSIQAKKLEINISAIEVWGISAAGSGKDALESQRKQLAWEEAEAARRRGVNFGGDKDGARHLLEMAGIVGQNQSGGSV